MVQPTKIAGTLRRAVRSQAFARIPGGRQMECAYYFDFCRLCRKCLQVKRTQTFSGLFQVKRSAIRSVVNEPIWNFWQQKDYF